MEKPKAPVRNIRTGAKLCIYISISEFYFSLISFLQSKLFPLVISSSAAKKVYEIPFWRCRVASFLGLPIAPTVTILYSAPAF